MLIQMLTFLRKALPFLIAGVLVAAAYDAWVFYSRWSYARDAELQRQAKEASDARRTLDLVGGGGLKLGAFYASPGAIRRGEQSSICFGVFGAKSVRIDPHIEDLRPAIQHCTQVSPKKTTEYVLTADDGAGHTASARVTVKVTP
jgi:hypothetical protein